MATTAKDIITDALLEIGVIAEFETPSAGQLSSGLRNLNRMLDSWSNNKLTIFESKEEEFALVPGQQSYTIGAGANFDTVRPQKITNAKVKIGDIEYPLQVLSEDEWARLPDKNISSEIPQMIFSKGSYPNDTLLFWPIPSQANTLILWSWKPLQSFASASSNVSLPPGYEDALVYNLAVRLCGSYNRDPKATTVDAATKALASIKRMNSKPVFQVTDPAILNNRNSDPYKIFGG